MGRKRARPYICEGCGKVFSQTGCWTGCGTSVKHSTATPSKIVIAEWCDVCVGNGTMREKSLALRDAMPIVRERERLAGVK